MNAFRNTLFALAVAATLGCTSSPTEPAGGTGAPIPPKPPDPVVGFSVTVTANPPEIPVGGNVSSTITVQVRRTDNGQPPPDGTIVRLTTTLGNFNSTSGPTSIDLQLVNGGASAALFSVTDTGTAAVRAEVNGSVGATNVRIGAPTTFFVSSVEPGVGDASGGETVAILGGGFETPVRVTFNGAAATVRSVTPSRITVTTPSAVAAGVTVGVGQTAVVSVAVTINVNETNQDLDTLERGFTYTLGGGNPEQPQIFSVTPQSGSNDGGTRVSIIGDGFQAPVQVIFGLGDTSASFNGVEATVESVTSNRIVVISPAAQGFGQNLTNQVVNILVRNINTGFSTIELQRFKYGSNVLITAFGPGSGPHTGGTPVTIQGSGFDDPVAVSLGGVGQTVVSVSGTQIVFITSGILIAQCPLSGFVEAVGVRVVNIETGDFDEEPNLVFRFTVPRPQIFGLNPIQGNVGSQTTISGQNFAPNVQVVFGDPTSGSSAPIVSQSATSIRVTVPNPPTGFTFNQEPCDGNGDGIPNGTRNAPTSITVSVRNLDGTGCVSTLTNAFTLNPPNTTCTGDTSVPPPPPIVQCNDGFDNDGDTLIDAADPGCTGPTDTSEAG